jgi:adenylate cyclase class 2
VTAAHRNVEIKAVDDDPARTLERALALGASDEGVLAQRDTYFAVPAGRLKLREQEPGGDELIAYERPDAAAVRVSAYRLVPVAHARELRAALEATTGIRVVVAKRRRLLLWETVRIHLDEVEGLGSFVELEAVVDAGSDPARERELIADVRAALEIGDAALLEGSYADAAIAAAPDPDLLALAREAAGRAWAADVAGG